MPGLVSFDRRRDLTRAIRPKAEIFFSSHRKRPGRSCIFLPTGPRSYAPTHKYVQFMTHVSLHLEL